VWNLLFGLLVLVRSCGNTPIEKDEDDSEEETDDDKEKVDDELKDKFESFDLNLKPLQFKIKFSS